MGRKVLFITTDQQRYDALGCNGGTIARTPVVDALASEGIRYERAAPPNVVCMPSRATMVTGQHLRTHGVWMNGVPLPADAPSVAHVLNDAGYRTALVGKAHFEPFLDPFLRFEENKLGKEQRTGPHRGFDHMELAAHSPMGFTHYAQMLQREHPTSLGGFFPVMDINLSVSGAAGGDTGAPQIRVNPIDRGLYHTDWVADRTIAWLDGLDADDDWFAWASFPDPHHPWDPPASEIGRVPWKDLDLPAGYIEDADDREAVLAGKPAHWLQWYRGDVVSNYEAPASWAPATLTADQVREVNALTHVENELVDEAVGRIIDAVKARGWWDDTDVIVSTDHGELQGDLGLLFKGPYHVDALMRLPLIWRPAPSAGIAPGVVTAPVGLVDIAPTICAAAGLPVPSWMDGGVLPSSDAEAGAQGRERSIVEWDSVHPSGVEVHLRTIYRDGMVLTACEPGTAHDGTEGELYALADDPWQRRNLWDDAAWEATKADLLADLTDNLPAWKDPILRQPEAPV